MVKNAFDALAVLGGTLVAAGALWGAGHDGYDSYKAGEWEPGSAATQLANACLKKPEDITTRAGKLVVCPLAGGALITAAVSGPLEGARIPKFNRN